MKMLIVLFIWLLIVVVVAATAPVKPVAISKQYVKTVVSDSSKITVVDTLLIIKHDTVKVINTFKDTTKLVKSDTLHVLKYDTLRIKKK